MTTLDALRALCEWQPMESCPKDREVIGLAETLDYDAQSSGFAIRAVWWNPTTQCWCSNAGDKKVLHDLQIYGWRELPKPANPDREFLETLASEAEDARSPGAPLGLCLKEEAIARLREIATKLEDK